MHKETQIIAFYFKENIQLVILITVNIKNSSNASAIVWSELYTPILRGGSPAPSVFSFYFLGIFNTADR